MHVLSRKTGWFHKPFGRMDALGVVHRTGMVGVIVGWVVVTAIALARGPLFGANESSVDAVIGTAGITAGLYFATAAFLGPFTLIGWVVLRELRERRILKPKTSTTVEPGSPQDEAWAARVLEQKRR